MEEDLDSNGTKQSPPELILVQLHHMPGAVRTLRLCAEVSYLLWEGALSVLEMRKLRHRGARLSNLPQIPKLINIRKSFMQWRSLVLHQD